MDDQKLVYADTSADEVVIDKADEDDPLLSPITEEPKKEEEEYKIYIPNEAQPQEESFEFDRTANLHAPIEQLEKDAQLANDFVESEEPVIERKEPEIVLPKTEEPRLKL
ncbi:hypothetical protein JCM19241_2982 [Vibrio ishigakensis]|uniref:Uncharacterized protein n=1 Tax=Vibrio ishigakensis TaxID=1481914 RepID=A0A0B8Q9D4_9VIBR|nr:hypothetical protein JCM19241_2982 [Vibrio ishigakensis]